MPNVYFTSFSNRDFYSHQQELIQSAKKFGLDNFRTYDFEHLKKTSFYSNYLEIFSMHRGVGYWLWKPYYILEVLKSIKDGEIVFYADSGCLLIDNPKKLIEICGSNESGIVAFDTWPLTNNQWSKRDSFVITDCDSKEYWFAPHVIATTMLIRKNDFTIDFVSQWLNYCCNKYALTEIENIHGKNIDGFIKHMGDQPIFSLLVKKYNIQTYRNPSVWGNFLKLPEFRMLGEQICYPYLVENSINDYSDHPYINSTYNTVFEFNRKKIQKSHKQGKFKIYEKIVEKIFAVRRSLFK